MFGSAELSGVDSGSGVVEFMVDALRVFKKSCAIVCLQLTLFNSKIYLSLIGKIRQ